METVQVSNPFTREMLRKLNESSKRYGHDLEFLEGALDWIVNQTKAKLTEEERFQYLLKLSTYPRSKLLSLDAFGGAHITHVWSYLDAVHVQLPNALEFAVKELPEPKSNIARDTFEHYKRMMAATGDIPYTLDEHEKKWAVEIEGLKELHKKYPNGGFDKALRQRQEHMINTRSRLKELGR